MMLTYFDSRLLASGQLVQLHIVSEACDTLGLQKVLLFGIQTPGGHA